jgi:hypothetical protein
MLNPLDLWPLVAIRRNHALEHATIHVLADRPTCRGVAGRSDWAGFTLYGQVSTADVVSAVGQALDRLRAGEEQLAVHPRCGTNLATGAVLIGLTSYASLRGRKRSRAERALQWMVGIAAALFLARPLGVRVQESITTSPAVGSLRVVTVRRVERGSMIAHRIHTAQA